MTFRHYGQGALPHTKIGDTADQAFYATSPDRKHNVRPLFDQELEALREVTATPPWVRSAFVYTHSSNPGSIVKTVVFTDSECNYMSVPNDAAATSIVVLMLTSGLQETFGPMPLPS